MHNCQPAPVLSAAPCVRLRFGGDPRNSNCALNCCNSPQKTESRPSSKILYKRRHKVKDNQNICILPILYANISMSVVSRQRQHTAAMAKGNFSDVALARTVLAKFPFILPTSTPLSIPLHLFFDTLVLGPLWRLGSLHFYFTQKQQHE